VQTFAGSLNAGITNTHASHKPLNMDDSLAMSLDVVRLTEKDRDGRKLCDD